MMKILVLPGDGIGPEVTEQAVRVLRWFIAHRGLEASVEERSFGLINWQRYGTMMPEETWARIEEADAILFGATGTLDQGMVPPEERRKGSLLRIRKALDLFANLRPVRMSDALLEASPYKPRVVQGVDLVILRELTGGMYFGTPRGVEGAAPDRVGINTHRYSEAEIARAARFAFQLARSRRNHVTSVDKANVMEAGALWREVVSAIHAAEFPDVVLEHMLVDNAAMQLARMPRRFDVILTDNLFGDVLSDAAGAILGSLGMLPSASLNADGSRALYEPVHGSAPDIAGRGIANPLGAILSVALLLRWSAKRAEDAALLEAAVEAALRAGARTADIAAPGEEAIGTRAMGDAVLAQLTGRPNRS
ncbi:MAG: 3-isopropylmalate dehydrogenase [Rhodovarius sp.]|nr:3-isopropylmalate dehydrogenase [Rhodovarius sp.]MDW8314784.1 3-isopropylmalate dehydrogenase [Rhodovarius sp.]